MYRSWPSTAGLHPLISLLLFAKDFANIRLFANLFFQLMITNKLTSFLKGGSLYRLDGCTRYYTVTFRFMAFLSLNNKINEICIVFSWWHLWVSFQLLKLAKKTLLETLTTSSWWISLWGHRIYIQRFLGKPSVCVNESVRKYVSNSLHGRMLRTGISHTKEEHILWRSSCYNHMLPFWNSCG